MTEEHVPTGGADDDPTTPVIRDKRRIDPSGQVRAPADDADSSSTPGGAADATPGAAPQAGVPEEVAQQLAAAQQEAAERLEDLKRLQAEYVNYRRRVERDRMVARELTIQEIVEAFMPVLDEIELARQHDDLTGPFAAIAEKVEGVLSRFGWQRYGAEGEPFDPEQHEAMMHSHSDEVDGPTVVQVLQPGHRVDDRIVRAARVAVAEPDG